MNEQLGGCLAVSQGQPTTPVHEDWSLLWFWKDWSLNAVHGPAQRMLLRENPTPAPSSLCDKITACFSVSSCHSEAKTSFCAFEGVRTHRYGNENADLWGTAP